MDLVSKEAISAANDKASHPGERERSQRMWLSMAMTTNTE